LDDDSSFLISLSSSVDPCCTLLMASTPGSELDIELPLADMPLDASEVTRGAHLTKPIPVRLATSKVILGEIQNVLAVMKLNSRWSDPIRNVCDPGWASNCLNSVQVIPSSFPTFKHRLHVSNPDV
jgi:hypothetical protein